MHQHSPFRLSQFRAVAEAIRNGTFDAARDTPPPGYARFCHEHSNDPDPGLRYPLPPPRPHDANRPRKHKRRGGRNPIMQLVFDRFRADTAEKNANARRDRFKKQRYFVSENRDIDNPFASNHAFPDHAFDFDMGHSPPAPIPSPLSDGTVIPLAVPNQEQHMTRTEEVRTPLASVTNSMPQSVTGADEALLRDLNRLEIAPEMRDFNEPARVLSQPETGPSMLLTASTPAATGHSRD